jgi:Zn-dependent protease with chaperone function
MKVRRSNLLTGLLSLLLVSHCAVKAENPSGCWITRVIKNVVDTNIEPTVTPANDALYRNLLREAGIKNVESIKISPWPNAENAAVSSPPSLLIDEAYFSTVPLEQLRFVIGHEATHINNNHVFKCSVGTASLMLLQYPIQLSVYAAHQSLIRAIKNERLKRCLDSALVHCIVHAGTFVCTCILPAVAMNWHCEFEADREGAKVLDCVQGGIGFLQGWENESMETVNTSSGLTFLKAVCKRYFWKRLSHPPLSWRIAELERLG